MEIVAEAKYECSAVNNMKGYVATLNPVKGHTVILPVVINGM
jgi:hypothetical protein